MRASEIPGEPGFHPREQATHRGGFGFWTCGFATDPCRSATSRSTWKSGDPSPLRPARRSIWVPHPDRHVEYFFRQFHHAGHFGCPTGQYDAGGQHIFKTGAAQFLLNQLEQFFHTRLDHFCQGGARQLARPALARRARQSYLPDPPVASTRNREPTISSASLVGVRKAMAMSLVI